MGPRRVTLVALVAGGHGGVPRYAQSLARAMDDVAPEFPDIELTLLTTRRGAEALDGLSLAMKTLPLRAPRLNRGPARIAADQLAVLRTKADLLHFFDLTGPLFAPRRAFVATIHDVSVARGYSVIRQAYKRRLYPWACRNAKAVVAISEFAKEEAVSQLGADPARVRVIHSGPGLPAGTATADDVGPDEVSSPPYFLFVGNLTASKNLPFLVRTFSEADLNARLMLVGRPGENYGDLRNAISASRHRDRIDVRHTVDDRELDRLYRHAVALVLPSRYEGFALTPLEAMARGCPVLASDIPAVREVSGAGAWVLPVDDVSAWSNAMREVLTDTRLRETLRRRGTETVASYSWQNTARQVCRLFVDVLGAPH